jgi:hypothetical protein
VGAVLLAVLAFVFVTQPTGAVILVIAALLLVALAVIEFLARPGTPAVDDGSPDEVEQTEPAAVPVPGPRAGA